MATINLVCTEHNFISLFENSYLNLPGPLGVKNLIKISKIDSLKRIYDKPKIKNNFPFNWVQTISELFSNKTTTQHLKLVDRETLLTDNEIIFFVNPSNNLSMEAISKAAYKLEQSPSQIIIDNVVYSLDCDECPKKAYWLFVHWMETLQSSAVIGQEAQATSYVALTRSVLANMVDFELEKELITYKKVV